MIKTFRFLLVAALVMVCGNMFAQDETQTVTWEASSGDALTTIYPDGNISLKWEEAGGDYAPSYANGSVKFYRGSRLTVAGTTSDVKIKQVVFTFSQTPISMVTCNASGKNESTTGITTNTEDLTCTWAGETGSVVFRVSKDANNTPRYITSIAVTYTGGTVGPVETKPALNVTTTLADTYDMDANGVFVVYAKNEGTAAAQNAKLAVLVDGTENASWEIGTLAIGEEKWKNMKFILESLEAGSHQVVLTLTADDAEPFELTKTVTFTKKAPEATFQLSAQSMEIQLPVENIEIPVMVANTSEVNAENVKINLWNNGIVATQEIAALAAGESTTVTFIIDALEAGEYSMQALTSDNKYGCSFTVKVLAAPEEDKIDMAITAIQGDSEIDLNGVNTYKVWYKNEGNVTVENADIILLVNDNEAGRQAVTVEAGQQGSVEFTLDVTNLFDQIEDLGQDATLIGLVNVDGDVNADNNKQTMTAKVTKTVAEPTFEVTAESIEIQLPAETFTMTATVKNTSEVAAENVEVSLFYNSVIDTQTVEALAAGAEATVTFTDVQNPFTVAGSYSIFVQAPKTNAEVTVTVLAAPEEEKIDMAIEAIQGATEINMKEENKVQVWYKNNGNVTMENVAIMFSVNDHAQEQTVTVEAGKNGFVEFTIPTDIFEPAEDVEAELIAWVNVEGDIDDTNNRMSKTLPIVSGEVEPAAEISLNPITSFEVEAGEQTVNVTVTVFNNGEVEAKDVKVELYKSYGDGLCEPQTVDVPAGEENWKILNFSFSYNFEAGKSYEFTAYTGYVDADPDNQMQSFTITCPAPVADVTIAKMDNIEATTEEEVKIVATIQNLSDVLAENVLVALYRGTEQIGDTKTVNEIEANAEAQVEFNLGTLAAGTYEYQVMITSPDANVDNNAQFVTVKVAEPVVETIDMAIIAIQGSSEINLKGDNTYKVWYKNEGNVKVENADIILLIDGENEAGRQAVTVEPGQQGSVEFTLDLADFDPIEDLDREVVLMGFVNVDGDVNPDNNKSSMTATVVSKEDVVDPVLEITAQPVEVEFGAEKFDVTATIKNVGEVAVEGLTVTLFYNGIIATEAIDIALDPNTEATVTFKDVENPFTKAGEYTMYVQAAKAQAEVTVTVKPEPVEEVVDMAITAIQGISQIDLTKENTISVWYKNEGNVDVEGVTIAVTLNGNEVETKAVDAIVKPEGTGYMTFTLPTEGLTAGETAKVIATVTVEKDGNVDNNSLEREYEVVDGETVEPTFAVAAENVTVEYGAESFDIVATITNTSDVDAQGLTVKLLKGITEVETRTADLLLKAGESTTETFTITATDENPFVAGSTVKYYVQAGNAQAEVTVTFAEEPVAEVVDLAIYAVTGSISLENEANYVTVWVNNNGTVDVNDAKVVLTVNGVEAELGEGTISVKAGQEYVQCRIQLIMDGLEAGILPIRAEVILPEGMEDINPDDNVMVQEFTVAGLQPVLNFTVAEVTAVKDAESFEVNITVANTGKGDAENVAVKVYDENSAELAAGTIASIAAGEEETATLTINKTYTVAGTYRNQLQVWVAGVDGVKWVNVTVNDTATSIAAVKAQYGENVQIFTINGQKVENLKKGLYIINGKKVMVK